MGNRPPRQASRGGAAGPERLSRRGIPLRRFSNVSTVGQGPSSLSPAIPHNWVYPSSPSIRLALLLDPPIPCIIPMNALYATLSTRHNIIHDFVPRCALASYTLSSPHTNHSPPASPERSKLRTYTPHLVHHSTPETVHPLRASAATVRREPWIHPCRGFADILSAWATGLGTARLFKGAASLLFFLDLGLVSPLLVFHLYTQAALIPFCSCCVVILRRETTRLLYTHLQLRHVSSQGLPLGLCHRRVGSPPGPFPFGAFKNQRSRGCPASSEFGKPCCVPIRPALPLLPRCPSYILAAPLLPNSSTRDLNPQPSCSPVHRPGTPRPAANANQLPD